MDGCVRVLRTKREERDGGQRRSRRNELQRFSMRITSCLLLSGPLVWLAWDCDSHSNFEKAFISPSLPACLPFELTDRYHLLRRIGIEDQLKKSKFLGHLPLHCLPFDFL